MSFILSAQRDDDVVRAFERYRGYLQSVRHSLPESVFALASSDWYFSPHEHRCPHDAWLESITISEPSSGKRHEVRFTSIRIRLLAAYHELPRRVRRMNVWRGYAMTTGGFRTRLKHWKHGSPSTGPLCDPTSTLRTSALLHGRMLPAAALQSRPK